MKIAVFKTITNTLKNAVARITKDSNGYFRFGHNDSLPNEIIDDVLSSGTAKACLNLLTRFTKADGLIDESLSISQANVKQTFDSLIEDLALNVVAFKAVVFRVLYDASGERSRIYSVPLNQIRRKGEDFVWNRNFGNKKLYRHTEDRELKEYNPKESPESRRARIASQITEHKEQIGDLVFYYKKGLGAEEYPIPDYYSEAAINDIRSDAAIARLEHRNVTKGFRTPIVISTGPVDKDNKDDNGKTEQDYFDETINGFFGEEASSAIHLEGATSEAKPTVTVIPIAEILDATDKATDRIGRKVCRHFNVAPSLVGFSTPGQLGNNQELVNQIKLMNMSVFGYQQMISEALKYVFPEKDWTLSTLKLFDYIPDSVLARLTDNEVREMFELKPVQNEATEVGV